MWTSIVLGALADRLLQGYFARKKAPAPAARSADPTLKDRARPFLADQNTASIEGPRTNRDFVFDQTLFPPARPVCEASGQLGQDDPASG